MSPSVTTASGGSTEINNRYELDKIGIELEYPIAVSPEKGPISDAARSHELRNQWGRGEDWVYSGYMGGDHVGAEITTEILPLHSDHPVTWYRNTIEECTDMGFPFVPTGRGATNFGLHMHLSDLPREKRNWLGQVCYEPWMRVFVCSSVKEDAVDPWRHGGVNFRHTGDPEWIIPQAAGGHSGHYEWRLPEPMKPGHLALVIEFLQTLEIGGPEAAREFALRHVEQRDERLTAIHQYQLLREENDDWPPDSALTCGGSGPVEQRCNEAARFLARLMGDRE